MAIDKDKVLELFGRYWEIAYNEGRTGEGFPDLANDVLAELRDALDADGGDVYAAEIVEIDGHFSDCAVGLNRYHDRGRMADITERLRQNARSEDCFTDPYPDVLTDAADEIDRLRARVAELEAERDDDDALRERMSDILKRTAIALRGPEPPLTAWSWHDLPERAAAAIASIDLFQRVAHNLADPRGLVPMLVDRFLAWKLPEDFAPDGGISFTLISKDHPEWWPTGTCLLNAPQATAMFEHLLGIDPPPQDGVELIDGCDCTSSVVQAAHGHHAGCPAKDGAQ